MDFSSAEESKLELVDTNISCLQRFKIRTAISLGPPELRHIYENEVYQLTLKVSVIACFYLTALSRLYNLSILFDFIFRRVIL
jgi:hypothetical protein